MTRRLLFETGDLKLPEKVSTNTIYAGKHWTKRKEYKESFYYAVRGHIGSRYEPIPSKVDIEFDFYFPNRPLDSSNCTFMGKMIEDAFVELGLLKDDNIANVGKVSYQSNRKKSEHGNHCQVRIYEAE